MKILSNEPCDISDYCGNIIVSYLEEDAGEVQDIKDWLQSQGYDYEDNAISPAKLLKSSYCDIYNALLKNCGLYIFPITNNFNEKFRPRINVILYQAGFLEASSRNRIYPYICKSYRDAKKAEDARVASGEDISKDPCKLIDLEQLPLRDLERVLSITSLDEKFKESDHKHISVYDYIKKNKPYKANATDKKINASTVSLFQRFISYRKLTVHFDITENDINNCIINASSRLLETEKGVISWLGDGIQCGTRIFAFGNESTITNSTRPYEEESRIDKDIALTIPNGRCFFIKNTDDEYTKTKIRGTLVTEFIIPVHKLLGVYYKCFIRGINTTNPNAREEQWGQALENLLASSFTDKNDATRDYTDIYFCFETQNSAEKKYKISIPKVYGKLSNYMHPQ